MNYALIEDGIVSNIIWLNYVNESDFPNAVKIDDRPVQIGDAYSEGKFYRNNEEILTPLEIAYKRITELEQINTENEI